MTADTMPGRVYIKNRFMKNPLNTKRVSRPGRFSNPFQVERTPEAHAAAVVLFRALCAADSEYRALIRRELAGYNLACACPLDWPCHADVLLEIAKSASSRK